MSFSDIKYYLSFVIKYRHVLIGLRTLPKMPSNWKDSKEVQTFVINMLKSDAVVALTATTVTTYDDKARMDILGIVQTDYCWDLLWSLVIKNDSQKIPDVEPVPDKLTLIERLKRLLKFRVETLSGTVANAPLSDAAIMAALNDKSDVSGVAVAPDKAELLVASADVLSGILKFAKLVKK